MLFGPECSSSDEEGFSDDNDYYEFKQTLKQQQYEKRFNMNLETELKQNQFKTIMSAISFGNAEVVTWEVDKGLQVDIDLESGWTPLLFAASVANNKIISLLLERGADVNQTREELTPLMLVCNNSFEKTTDVTECVKTLLEYGADVNEIDLKRRTAFMLAAYNGHLDAVKLLLPYVDKEAEDNQRWTALFWAVDGHRTDIVKLLLEECFTCDKIDVRGNTVVDIAYTNGYEDILELLPSKNEEEFYLHLINNPIDFENTFNNLNKNEMPDLFPDVCKIMYGTRSENVLSVLREKNVTLPDILSATPMKLEEFGIQLPYQRNRIMGGLYKFHKHPFHPRSMPLVKKNELYTSTDIALKVVSCIKQLMVMESSLKYILLNGREKMCPEEIQNLESVIEKNRYEIKRLKVVVERLLEKTENWDLMLKPADRITKKRWNIPWSNVCLSVGVVSVAAFAFFKMKCL